MKKLNMSIDIYYERDVNYDNLVKILGEHIRRIVQETAAYRADALIAESKRSGSNQAFGEVLCCSDGTYSCDLL